jgi:hypothetical protein
VRERVHSSHKRHLIVHDSFPTNQRFLRSLGCGNTCQARRQHPNPVHIPSAARSFRGHLQPMLSGRCGLVLQRLDENKIDRAPRLPPAAYRPILTV